jgi:hypothetical protein
MAAMVLTMLCIGVTMIVSLANYSVLVSIHRPLGIAILILVVIRFVNRLVNRPPPPSANRLRQHGHWPSLRFRRAENAVAGKDPFADHPTLPRRRTRSRRILPMLRILLARD